MKKLLIGISVIAALAVAGCKFDNITIGGAKAAEVAVCQKGSLAEFEADIQKVWKGELELVYMRDEELKTFIESVLARPGASKDFFDGVTLIVWAKIPGGQIGVAHFDKDGCIVGSFAVSTELWGELMEKAFGPDANKPDA
jgi:hypothetical protein